jgi:hypothetical protein
MAIVQFKEEIENKNAERTTRQKDSTKDEPMLTDNGNSYKGDFSPKAGFIQIQRAAEDLLEADPDAYLLMSQIMFRALRKKNKYNRHGLEPNQALVGDFESCGLTRQRYRSALLRLKTNHLITTKKTNKGTIATILGTEFCDINPENKTQQNNHQATIKQPLKNNEIKKEYIKNTSNEVFPSSTSAESEKRNITYNIRNKSSSQPPSALRTAITEISFSFDSNSFENISDKDKQTWKELYPAINLDLEIKRASEWCLSNQSKAKSKKKWRQFLNNWFKRANEEAVNRAAYQSRKGGSPSIEESKDRAEANRKRVMAKFQDGQYYNSAKCNIAPHKVYFWRQGVGEKEVYFKDSSFDEQFTNMLRLYNINVTI